MSWFVICNVDVVIIVSPIDLYFYAKMGDFCVMTNIISGQINQYSAIPLSQHTHVVHCAQNW